MLAKDEDILCLGKRDQCKEGKNRIGAIEYHGVKLKEGMTVSKHSSHKEKIKSQEKEATLRIALGFGEHCLGIWAKWSHFSKTFLKTHLGFDPIYKTQKWFSKRSSSLIHNIF